MFFISFPSPFLRLAYFSRDSSALRSRIVSTEYRSSLEDGDEDEAAAQRQSARVFQMLVFSEASLVHSAPVVLYMSTVHYGLHYTTQHNTRIVAFCLPVAFIIRRRTLYMHTHTHTHHREVQYCIFTVYVHVERL